MREPDALDSARVLALALLAVAGVGLLPPALPAAVRGGLLQLAFLAVPLAYVRAARLDPVRSHGARRPSFAALGLVAAASVGSLWLLKSLVDAQADAARALGFEDLLRGETRQIQEGVERVQRHVGLVGVALFAVIPPVCEEALFRGAFFRGLIRGTSVLRAHAYTALLFAAMHGKISQLLPMTFLGLYFAAVVWLSGSLWTGILAHALNNAAVLILTLRYGDAVNDLRAPLWMLALSAVVFGGALASLALLREPGPGQGLGWSGGGASRSGDGGSGGASR